MRAVASVRRGERGRAMAWARPTVNTAAVMQRKGMIGTMYLKNTANPRPAIA